MSGFVSAPKPHRTRGFRMDIQALRALAVLSVLLYHLWPHRLTGGFVGVDVFFVISGYLITSHLLRERAQTGRIRLGAFWSRRAARLLPASLIVLTATSIGTILWAPLSLRGQFFGEIVASTLYVQNWRLLTDSVDYLAADNSPSPVQHFWTLSVEEQFYVLLPLLLIASFWIFRRWSWRVVAFGAIAVTTLASFGYGVWLLAAAPSEAYFSTFTRAWEFGLGALLAFAPPLTRRALAHTTTAVGLALVLASVAFFSGETPFPGPMALLPVVGTALAIWGGASSFLERVGRLPPIAFTGEISYSMYLWHWPLIILLPFITDTPLGTPEKLAIGAATFLLAWLSTRFVENPVRTSPRVLGGRGPKVTLAAAATATLLVVALPVSATAAMRAEEDRLRAITDQLLAQNPDCFGAQSMDPALAPCENTELENLPLVPSTISIRQDDANQEDCWSRLADPTLRVCSLGPSSGYDRHVFAVGDSHNNVLVGAYALIAERLNWRIDVAGHEGCHWTAEALEQRTADAFEACSAWRSAVTEHLAAPSEIDAIIVTRFSGHQDEDDVGVDGLVQAWQQRHDLAVPVIAIRDNPRLPGATVACIEADPSRAAERCAVPRDQGLVDDGQARAVERDPNAMLVDMTDFYCDATVCSPIIGGVIVYRDGSHLTATYAHTLAPYLAKELQTAVG